MTTSNSLASTPNSNKTNWLFGCVFIALAIFFGILGVYNLIYGAIISYVFFFAQMLSLASIVTMLIIACNSVIYFILAFRIKRQRWFISLALLVVVWLMLPMALRFSINVATMRVRNDGYSMMPALTNGDYILADRQAYQKHLPKRGDIVIFTSPTDTGRDLIKRIIGLPGETVKIAQGQVLINGVPLNEPYISVQAAYRGEWKIPQDQYFVLGDNRNDSRDSHQWGFLPKEYILAKAVWIYWPSVQFGKIEDINFSP